MFALLDYFFLFDQPGNLNEANSSGLKEKLVFILIPKNWLHGDIL